jgi:threonine dehydratase
MTFGTLREGLADFVLVSDDDIRVAMREIIDCTGNLPESAGAAGFAGAKRLAPRLAGQRIAVILCGGNASVASLRLATE